MPITVIVCFVVLFALIMLAVSVGLKFFDSRRKKQVVDMLQTASGEPVTRLTNLLRELETEKKTGLNAVASTLRFNDHAAALLQQAGLSWTPGRLLTVMGVMAGMGLLIGSALPVPVSPIVTAPALAMALGSMPYLFVRYKRKKRLDGLEEQLPEALEFLSRSMRAGHAFTISLEMVGEELADPLGQEFRTLFNEQNLGAPLDVALNNFGNRVPLLDIRFFTSSVLLQKQTGGNLSEILVRLAYIIRERFRLKGQVRAASAHGRMTATILTVLPIATMIGLLIVAPGYLQGMANDDDGRKLIAGALVAQVLGNYFIRKIIQIKV
jgi:tight adherence protein B